MGPWANGPMGKNDGKAQLKLWLELGVFNDIKTISARAQRALGRRIDDQAAARAVVVAGIRDILSCGSCSAEMVCPRHGDFGAAAALAKAKKAEDAYACAYAEGQREASGDGFTEPRSTRDASALWKMAAEFGKTPAGVKLTGQQLCDWIRETSAAFRRSMADKAEFQSGFAPHACLAWLQAGRPDGAKGTMQRAPVGTQRRSRRETIA